jgi:hypothetical protein
VTVTNVTFASGSALQLNVTGTNCGAIYNPGGQTLDLRPLASLRLAGDTGLNPDGTVVLTAPEILLDSLTEMEARADQSGMTRGVAFQLEGVPVRLGGTGQTLRIVTRGGTFIKW